MLLTLSSLVASLLVATLAHEGGHLVAALALRCEPRFLCVGRGPVLLRRRLGSVWVVLRALPVGGHVLMAPPREGRGLALFGFVAAGPAANAALLALLVAGKEALPDPVWFAACLAQLWLLIASLLPHRVRSDGARISSDGSKMLAMLRGRPEPSLDATYAEVAARMRPGGDVPAMTAAFAEIVVQLGRRDRGEAWARRQVIDAMEGLIGGPEANALERALALTALHAEVDAGQELFRRGRRGAGAGVPAAACCTAAARGTLQGWLWIAVLAVAVIGPIYESQHRAGGEAGRLDAAQLRFDLSKDRVDGHRLVALQGTIGAGAIVELREAIERYGLGPGDTLLLDSPGGNLGNAEVMGRIIRRHALATAVGALRGGTVEPADCASACVALFAAGTRRTLPKGSRIGIHDFRSLGAEAMSAADVERSRLATERREVAYFAEMGVAPGLEATAASVPAEDIRWLTPEEAVGFGLATSRGDAG